MIRNGKKMRVIPSLDGALYQFDGEKVEGDIAVLNLQTR